MKQRIAILGDGITGKAVRQKATDLGFEIVAPESAELVIASPGIPPADFPDVKVPIISDIEWAFRLFQEFGNAPFLIGITGTNGKSTVTSLVGHMLDIPLAGNIGVPLISYVGLEQIYPQIVVELSSYQLETCIDFRPDIAVLLNVTPDHLRRHGNMDDYMVKKANASNYKHHQTP